MGLAVKSAINNCKLCYARVHDDITVVQEEECVTGQMCTK